ncbi:MAG: hypothetical protein GQ565_12570 [Candidatus Aegiribacteria sp.]|nr:hypothetical protein [Candidatus Aegiribacteria sp.]
MIEVTQGNRPEEINMSGKHVLFVEGCGSDSFDSEVISELFDWKIRIEPLGSSYSINSVAEALHPFHPTYYFLIDRDHHHDDNKVDYYWENFPDPQTHNLLIWKYREIENYFLEPAYLEESDFLNVNIDTLEKKIIEFCQQRLYLDVANYVIVSIREELKRNWIRIFSNPSDFSSRDLALGMLKNAGEFEAFRNEVGTAIDHDEITRCFDDIFDIMTDGSECLEFGKGKWLEMIGGKRVFSQVINSTCFKVVDLEGSLLHGKDKINQVAKNLLRKNISKQPDDFKKLKTLILDRLNSE